MSEEKTNNLPLELQPLQEPRVEDSTMLKNLKRVFNEETIEVTEPNETHVTNKKLMYRGNKVEGAYTRTPQDPIVTANLPPLEGYEYNYIKKEHQSHPSLMKKSDEEGAEGSDGVTSTAGKQSGEETLKPSGDVNFVPPLNTPAGGSVPPKPAAGQTDTGNPAP